METVLDEYGKVSIVKRPGDTLPLYKSVAEMGDYGKIQSLMKDPKLEEVMCIGNRTVKVYHRKHGYCSTEIVVSNDEIMEIAYHVASASGKAFDDRNSILNATLPDGSRLNATHPRLSPMGATLTIRKFTTFPLTIVHLIRSGTISQEAAALLWMFVDGLGTRPSNMVITGGVSTGKTTLLNSLSTFIPPKERIITIEDTAELRLGHENWVRLEATEDVSIVELLKNSLRMKPDRIIVGEIRGEEAYTLFNAMNVGQRGVMGTLHSNSSREMITRVVSPPMNVPADMLKSLDLVIVLQKFARGGEPVRKVVEISEIGGMEYGKPTVNTIFRLDGGGLKSTGAPSILREKISGEANMSLADFDSSLKARNDVLAQLIAGNQDPLQINSTIQGYSKG